MIRVALTMSTIVGVWLGVAIGARIVYADRILPGTTMAGVNLGGRPLSEARRMLTAALAPGRTVRLTAAGQRFVLRPAQVGYRIDVPASVARARNAAREGSLSGLWSTVTSLFMPRRVEPVVHIDRGQLETRVAEIAMTIARTARPGSVIADAGAPGGIRVVGPRAQRVLERPAADDVLLSALHERLTAPIALPVLRRGGATRAQVQAIQRQARAYLRAPLRLIAPTRVVEVGTRQLAGVLALHTGPNSRPGALRLGVDTPAVMRLVVALARDLDRAPVDARIRAPARPRVALERQGDVAWRPRRAAISVAVSATGRRLQQAAAVVALTNAVRRGLHEVTLAFTPIPARVATTAARAVTSLLGTFTTRYDCCQPRVTNIRLIAKAVDGTVVMPGERFSLNEIAGKRTRADGYVKAPFISDGALVPSVGGGVSQFSTTLYNAAYFAGLRLDSHRPHSFYISRYPAGREATLNYPDIDLRWTNDTRAPVLIRASTDQTSVVVSLYGVDTGRRVRARSGPRTPLAGRDFAITVTRVLRFGDGKVMRQVYTTRYDRPPPPE